MGIGVVKSKIEVDARQGVAGINAFKGGLLSLSKVSEQTRKSIDLLAHSTQALSGAIKTANWIKDHSKQLIEANVNYERLQVQLTGLIATNTKNIDSMGKMLDASTKWALSTKEADRVLAKLNETNLKTKFSLNEVAAAFSMFYATASNQGSRDDALKAFDSIALAAQAVGKNMRDLVPMFDSLATGTVIASSEMGSFMKMVGLTNEELKKANQNGEVFTLISEKLAKYKDLSNEAAKGYDIAMGNLKNSINELNKELGKPIFEAYIKGLNSFSKLLDKNKDLIVAYYKELASVAKAGLVAYTSFKTMTIGAYALNKAIVLINNIALPDYTIKNGVATVATSRLTSAVASLKMAFKTFLPVAVITSLFEYYSTMKEIKNATKDSRIEISNWQLYTTEAVQKVKTALELSVNGWKLYFVSLGEFFAGVCNLVASKADNLLSYFTNKFNSFMAEMTRFSNFISGLVGLKPVESFKINRDGFKGSFDNEVEFYRKKREEITRQNDELLKSIATNQTKALIDAHNKEVDNRKKTNKEVANLVDENSKFIAEKSLKTFKDFSSQRLKYLIEYYEKSGKYQEAWALKERELLKEFKRINLDKKTADAIVKFRKKEYLDSFVKESKMSFNEIKDSWSETILSMAKAVEDNFFNFFTGKIRSFKDMFKKLKNDLVSAFISPYAKEVSSGLGSFFASIFGQNTNKASVSKMATSLGLTLANGVYAGEVNGVSVKMDSAGNIMQGSSAFDGAKNILSLASNLNTVNKLFSGNTGIIETFKNLGSSLQGGVTKIFDINTYKNLFSNFQGNLFGSISGVFGDIAGYSYKLFGNAALSGAIANFGTNFSSALTLGGHIGSGFSAGLGTVAGASLLGYGGGKLIGGLGDKLFGAETYAGKYGSIAGLAGGAVGGLGASLGAFGSFAGPIGAGVGAVLGAIIGGFRGKTKIKDSGIQAFNDFLITQNGLEGNEIKNFVDKQKKSWFKKKRWTTYSNITKKQRDEINALFSSVYDIVAQNGGNLDFLKVKAGKWSKGEGFTDVGVKTAVVRAMMQDLNVDSFASKWKDLKSVIQGVGEAGAYRNEIKNLSFNNPVMQAKNQMDSLNKALTFGLKSKTNLDKFKGVIDEIGELSAKEFLKIYNESLKKDFTPDNLEVWKKLTKTFKDATNAAKAYTKTIIEYSKNIYSLMGAYFNSIGKANNFTPKVLNEQLNAIKTALKYDLKPDETKALKDFSFESINEFFSKLDDKGLRAFLENGDYELRSTLLGLATEYNEFLKQTTLNAIKALDELQKSFFISVKRSFELNLSILEKQLNIIKNLENQSNKLNSDVFKQSNSQKYFYNLDLESAKAEYKKGNFDSDIFNTLINSSNNYAKRLLDSSTSFEKYSYEMLKMAGELESVGGGDKESVELKISQIKELLNLGNQNIESAKKELLRVNETASNQLSALKNLLGKDSALFKGLRAIYNATISLKPKEAKQKLDELSLTPFANGGIVTAPTNALIGEAGYPEAVIPLKDGKGLKIDTSGAFERLYNKFDAVEKLVIALLMNSNNSLRILRSADSGEGLLIKDNK